jgi:hypothetical protein
MPKGMPLGTKVYHVDRYEAVKFRQRLKEELLKTPTVGYITLFKRFLHQKWLPEKTNGELLDEFSFRNHLRLVKKDLNHNFSGFFLSFLHRAAIDSYKYYHKQGKAPSGYSGIREIVNATGLQETNIRDILILNGSIK